MSHETGEFLGQRYAKLVAEKEAGRTLTLKDYSAWFETFAPWTATSLEAFNLELDKLGMLPPEVGT
jgi:hypothetical protein